MIANDQVVSSHQDLIRYSEVEPELSICEDDVIGLVDDEDAIDCRLGLCLQQCGLEQQSFLSLFAVRDVAHGRQQRWSSAQCQLRQAHLSRKHIPVFSLMQPLETFLAIEKSGGNPLF